MPPHDKVHAPDGRLWYDLALEEAEKRGQLQAELEQCHAKSTCCCGEYVKEHNMGSGHSPVSMYDHALYSVTQQAERLRTYIESIDGKHIGTKTDGDTFIDEGCIVAADILNG